jgi:hypothetical protein
MRSPCWLCISFINFWTSLYETWYVYHVTWSHLSGVLHKSLPSVCVFICVSLPLPGNGSVPTFPRQLIHETIEELLNASFSLRSMSYLENRLLFLPRTSSLTGFSELFSILRSFYQFFFTSECVTIVCPANLWRRVLAWTWRSVTPQSGRPSDRKLELT